MGAGAPEAEDGEGACTAPPCARRRRPDPTRTKPPAADAALAALTEDLLGEGAEPAPAPSLLRGVKRCGPPPAAPPWTAAPEAAGR